MCELLVNGVSFIVVIEVKYCNLVYKDSKFVVNSCFDVKFGIDGIDV